MMYVGELDHSMARAEVSAWEYEDDLGICASFDGQVDVSRLSQRFTILGSKLSYRLVVTLR
jgi:hypothetical protein